MHVAIENCMKKLLTTISLVAVTATLAPLAFVGCSTTDDRNPNKRTAGQRIDDTVLATKVRSALGNSDIYKFPDVKVETYKGTVQLSGFVASQEQKRKAEDIARNVQGVYNVQNNISMKADTERVRGTDTTTTRSTNTITTPRTTPDSTTTPIR
jgi:hypothetical protein